MIFKLIKKAKQIHQCCYNFCYDLFDETPESAPPVAEPAPEPVNHDAIDHTGITPKPTFMKGFLCASFENETSLGLAAMVVAIDEWHAKKLLNAELKKYSLRLEENDKLIEIDLHNPGVLLAMSDSDNWPE